MNRSRRSLSTVFAAPLSVSIERNLRGLRVLTQFLAFMSITDKPLAWLNGRLEPFGVAILPDVQGWIGWPVGALFLGLAIWEMNYDAHNPRRGPEPSSLPTRQSEQSLYLLWLGLGAFTGVMASIFFGLSLAVCLLIGVIVAVPGLIPVVRERLADILFGKREVASNSQDKG